MSEEGLLQTASDITVEIKEFKETMDFMDDENINLAIGRLVKIIAKPHMPPNIAAALVVELQALATSFAIKKNYYMSMGKGEPNSTAKKNMYFSLSEHFSKLADSVKYLAK